MLFTNKNKQQRNRNNGLNGKRGVHRQNRLQLLEHDIM